MAGECRDGEKLAGTSTPARPFDWKTSGAANLTSPLPLTLAHPFSIAVDPLAASLGPWHALAGSQSPAAMLRCATRRWVTEYPCPMALPLLPAAFVDAVDGRPLVIADRLPPMTRHSHRTWWLAAPDTQYKRRLDRPYPPHWPLPNGPWSLCPSQPPMGKVLRS